MQPVLRRGDDAGLVLAEEGHRAGAGCAPRGVGALTGIGTADGGAARGPGDARAQQTEHAAAGDPAGGVGAHVSTPARRPSGSLTASTATASARTWAGVSCWYDW